LGAAPLPQQRGVDQLVSVLRGKIAAAGSTKVRIVPIRAVGYRLVF
jgi:DNA-binding response OmpR family regulator